MNGEIIDLQDMPFREGIRFGIKPNGIPKAGQFWLVYGRTLTRAERSAPLLSFTSVSGIVPLHLTRYYCTSLVSAISWQEHAENALARAL